MSDAAIRKALETRLALMQPPLPTAYENHAFTPTQDTAHQRVEVMRSQPENPTYDSFRRHIGLMQVTLMYPTGKGPGSAEARAEAIRAHFPRGLTLTASGVTVTIDGTSYVMSGYRDEGWWAVPVRIPYHANIS